MDTVWIWDAARDGQGPWELVSDQVMGGVSDGTLTLEEVAGRTALRMTGQVSLENDGGFLQVARDIGPATGFAGIAVTVLGTGPDYNLHLRTAILQRPWQSFRASFATGGGWDDLVIPFDTLTPHRTDRDFDASDLCRLGLVAIGREFHADLSLARLGFTRAAPDTLGSAPSAR